MQEIIFKMDQTIIYLRTSTEQQSPGNQLRACKELSERLGLHYYNVIEDQMSAWKQKERQGFNQVKELIKASQVKALVVWDLDRIFRNRKKLIEFFEFCKVYSCKIFSVRQEWLENLNKIQEPFNEIMFDLMLQIMGWLAEEESNKKSQRVKAAIRIDKGITKSYKGHKWGRRSLSKNTIKQVLDLHKQGKSMREISKLIFYWDTNNNKRQIALSSVHKIITEYNNS